ncbi:MAG TPA: hypothetical protein VKX49_06575 [Bryobacteraceae bacterium]|nr:hypothetical protein [Bryobacteraceae bacterium]
MRSSESVQASRLLRESRLPRRAKSAHLLASAARDPGQSCPKHCPYPEEAASGTFAEPLGPPLSIQEAAKLIGCSAWTIRQRYLAAGIPHHRATPNGKLIFYRNQVIRWLLRQQEKGGTNP